MKTDTVVIVGLAIFGVLWLRSRQKDQFGYTAGQQLAAANYETSYWTGSGAAQAPSGPGIIPGLQWRPA